MSEKQAKYAVTIKEETVDAVAKRIAILERNGEINFPADYSPQNALKSAWLILQEVKDREKKPALEVCTRPSIMHALLDMVIQGLNPAKKQGYFIVYGNQLTFQRSYFGSMALAMRVDDRIGDIVAEVVYQGDEFEYEIVRGRKRVARHKQTFESVDSGKIIGAYCTVYGHDGQEIKADIMTWKEIQSAWKKSKAYPVLKDGGLKEGTTHADYTAEMVRRTVINRCCKPIINSSSDRLLMASATRSEFVQAEEEADAEIHEHANQETIDVEPEPEPEPPPQSEADAELDAIIDGGAESTKAAGNGRMF